MHIWLEALSGNIHLIKTIISQTITTAVTVTPDGGSHPHVTWGAMCDLMTLRAWTPLWTVSAALCSGALHWVTVQHWLTRRWSGWPPRAPRDHWPEPGPHLSQVPGPRPELPPSPGSHWPGSARSLLSSLSNLKTEYKMKMYTQTMVGDINALHGENCL